MFSLHQNRLSQEAILTCKFDDVLFSLLGIVKTWSKVGLRAELLGAGLAAVAATVLRP